VAVVTPQLLESVATVARSMVSMQGQLLVQREVQAALRKLPQQPAPSVAAAAEELAAAAEELAAAACSAEVSPVQEQLAEMREQLTDWQQQQTDWQQQMGTITEFMEQAGFPAGATGEQLQ
jgi:hypothetical protein